MKICVLKFVLLIGLTQVSASTVYAETDNDQHREYGAHVHGQAQLDLVLDQTNLSIELESPTMNVLGFEHEPRTTDEKSALADAAEIFGNGNNVITLQGGGCQLTEHTLEMPFTESHAINHGDDNHDTDEHDHDHSEIHASYLFSCKNGNAVEKMHVNLFKLFPGFEQINLQWVVFAKQGKQVLTKSHAEIEFK